MISMGCGDIDRIDLRIVQQFKVTVVAGAGAMLAGTGQQGPLDLAGQLADVEAALGEMLPPVRICPASALSEMS